MAIVAPTLVLTATTGAACARAAPNTPRRRGGACSTPPSGCSSGTATIRRRSSRFATAADVSVETIYKPFGSKAGMLKAALDAAVADAPEPAEFFGFPAPPIEETLRATTDPQVQLRTLAQFSARRLERLAPFHRMLRSAGVGDPEQGHYIAADHTARRERQCDNIQTIAANGPLRLPPGQAAGRHLLRAR